MSTDWAARRRQADAFAVVMVSLADGRPAQGRDPEALEDRHPEAFAQAVRVWSLAHPPQPDPLTAARFDVRSGPGAAAYALARTRSGAVQCTDCGDWVFREELALSPQKPGVELDVCRQCVAREKARDGG
ncbi:hypothetical protein ACFPC0_10600 [Streptomyces andamanensis]|uniref:DksA C4-type domain-containing protein n=1 Tax=Streptomyces andamanensis TaxID=1565035 RepID=A0ABV8TCD7_9ACTN